MSEQLLSFIQQSPSPFHVVSNMSKVLEQNGFQYMGQGNPWVLEKGKKYYTTRNGSSMIAFYIGKDLESLDFRMSASHTDSPTFKIKHNALIQEKDNHWVLNVEGYGSMIQESWLDTPLSIAGRVMVKEKEKIQSKLVYIDRDLFMIPRVAIHLKKENKECNPAIDLRPLYSIQEKKPDLNELLASHLGCDSQDILGKDLMLVNRQKQSIWGINQEFISSPRLDDLQGVYASLQGFIQSDNQKTISILACFDNEEVGSNTLQGAMSTFLSETLQRISHSLGYTLSQYQQSCAHSFLVSVDNAHAMHPNHTELCDNQNHPIINQGIVIKENASQRYTTDAYSRALFTEICRRAQIPVQVYANRSDQRGGSTLGNLSNMQVSVHALDIGLPQWAMHSSMESAGNMDTQYMMDALCAYYNAQIQFEQDSIIIK